MLEELQDLALFSQARKVAELAELPIDSLIINEVREYRCEVEWSMTQQLVDEKRTFLFSYFKFPSFLYLFKIFLFHHHL